MKGRSILGFILACLFFLPAVARAQVTASVVGTVQDTSGAVVPAVAVTVRNLETGAARSVETDERGYYRALSLPVGRYEVVAEKAGFKRQVRTGINLVVGQEAVVNLSLEVGEVQQAVTVTAEAPIVNTTTASTSGLVGERQIKDLPLNGRSFDNLITLNPGTTTSTAMKSATGARGPGNFFNIAGRRGTENLFLMNGIEFTGSALVGSTPGGASGQMLGIDAVREFNLQANTYGAQYGKRSGGQINVVTMSGSNQFHGTVFEFLRNSTLDARNFFDRKRFQSDPRLPPFRRNNFGGSAGGPIRRDKTFVFGSYEGLRQALTTTNLAFVPDANARRGFLPTGPGGALVDVGLAPGMAQYFVLYPEPNGRSLGGGIAESFNPASNPVREDFGTVRLDHIVSEKDWLSGSYTVSDGSSTTPQANPLSGTLVTLRAQVLSLEETHTFSPNVINTARVGFSRGAFYQDTRPLISLPANLSLIAGLPMGQVIIGGGGGVASGAVSNFGGIVTNQVMNRNLFTYTDSVQIVKGKHLLNLGAWFQRVQMNELFVSSGYGGVNFADLLAFLQGRAAQLTGTPPIDRKYSRQWEGAWYVEDTIRVLPNLTLNIGLRHEFTNGWNVHPLGPVGYRVGADGVLVTQPRINTQMFTENNSKWLFAPRIGLAWDPWGNGKTSVRAAFGTYHDFLDDITYIIPQPSSFQFTGVQFPYQVVVGAGQLPSGGAQRPRGLFPLDAKTPTVQQWSLTVEQELTPSTALSVGYVGSRGYHILGSSDWNPTRSVICPASPCPGGIPDGTRYFPSAAQTARLNPQLASTNAFASFVYTRYNSLQVDVRQRFSRGLTFRANYSFSKALDNGSVNVGGSFANCAAGVMDPQDPPRDYGPACYDVTNRFAFSGSYELPIGPGKAFLNGLSGVAERLLGGWRLNGIVSLQDGFPFTPVIGFGNSRNGGTGGNERPSVNPNFSGRRILGTPNKWFDPKAFLLPPAGTYGNLGRNALRGPGLASLDLSLFKDTRLTERVNLEFRAEVFNFFNRSNFGPPSIPVFTSTPCSDSLGNCPAGVPSGTVGALVGSSGVISSTSTTSRQIQFGLKLIW